MKIFGTSAGRIGLFALLALLSAPPPSGAAPTANSGPFLDPLFADNMVLQRGQPDAVWGWTQPGAAVTVTMNGQTAQAVAGTDGKWTARIGPFPAGGPYTLTASGPATDPMPQTATAQNVLVGDVWLCSGQSNMTFGLTMAKNGAQEVAGADQPKIRLLLLSLRASSQPERLIVNQWQVCTPQTVAKGGWGGFSAVAYFFGRSLQQDIGVPIGLIQSSFPGTAIQPWLSADALRAVPGEAGTVADLQKADEAKAQFPDRMEAWYEKHDAGSRPGQTWADPALAVSDWKTVTLPGNFKLSGPPALAGFQGVTWLRHDFLLPSDWSGQDLQLTLGPIFDYDTTYVNGRALGGLTQFSQPRSYRVPPSLLRPGRNVIAVRDLNFNSVANGGPYGKPALLAISPVRRAQTPPIPLAGPWQYKIGGPLPKDDPVPRLPVTNQATSTALYNAMIAPLLPFGLKGVIWYQGESNVQEAKLYRLLLPALIGDWRARFGQGDFPFLIVQLPNFKPTPKQPGESQWAELREAQLQTAQSVPHTGLAVAIDVGEPLNLHPKDKQDVGSRLALTAEAIAYNKPGEYSGPLYQSMSVEGSAIRVRFSHAAGLTAKDGGPVQGFALAGADGRFIWADAKIDGETVLVSSPSVPQPAAVRYAWADGPAVNLYNAAGLPAAPFRTK